MKFRKFGRIALALAVSLGTGLGVTSCTTDNTVGYLWVTATQYGQISAFRIDHNLGILTPAQNSPYPSGGVNPVRAVVAGAGRFRLCAQCRVRRDIPNRMSRGYPRRAGGREYLPFHCRRWRLLGLPDRIYEPGKLPDLAVDQCHRVAPLRPRFADSGHCQLHLLCEHHPGVRLR